MGEDSEPQEGEIILYSTAEGAARIEVLYDSETFWLSQKKMAELFGVDVRTVSEHLANIFATGELALAATVRRIRRVQREGTRDVRREIEFYNLDAIIAVGYRVNSARATQFRIWATETLKEGPILRLASECDADLVGESATAVPLGCFRDRGARS